MVTLFGVSEGAAFVSGSSLTLTCSIESRNGAYVDTPTTVISHWDTPNNVHDRANEPNATSVVLNVLNLETADSGDYTCFSSMIDSSDSEYIENSMQTNSSERVIVSKYIVSA